MASIPLETNEEIEARSVRIAERPIFLDTFLELNIDSGSELIGGVMVKKMAAQLAHEKLIAWLLTVLNAFVSHKQLGLVLSSRFTVRIDDFNARLPDLLFVREDHSAIVQPRAVYGAPDLVIELISPNDRPSDIIDLETDYRSIQVPEIVFIDQQKRQVLVLRRHDDTYDEVKLTAGILELASIDGFALQVSWFFDEPRPDAFTLVRSLLKQ